MDSHSWLTLPRASAGGRYGGNINPMELAIEEAFSVAAFGPEHILAIHARLLERANPRLAGRFRTVQNWIDGNDYNPCGADFVPPPPEYLAI
jgi:hypothetical protein